MNNNALQMLNMFKTATQIAQARNVYEFRYHIQRAALLELFKRAFPYIQDEANLLNMVDMAMRG